MAKKTGKVFTITARVTSLVSIDVIANDLAEALEKSKACKENDFINVVGDLCYSSCEVYQIAESGKWEL